MIKLTNLLTEDTHEYGCIMAHIDENSTRSILNFNHAHIDGTILYKEGEEYGREQTPHVTLKYGLVRNYSEEQIKKLFSKITPFNIHIKGISLFENENFDVLKFDVDGPELRKLNELLSKLPNEDQYPEYHPHMTLAYVQKGTGKHLVKSVNKLAKIPVNSLVYSSGGNKVHYPLTEGLSKMPSKMYHGTSKENANKIFKYGLIPTKSGGIQQKHNDVKYEHGIYLTTDKGVATNFGGSKKSNMFQADDAVVLTIDTSKLDPKKANPDPMFPNNSIIYLDKIPPKYIIDFEEDDLGHI